MCIVPVPNVTRYDETISDYKLNKDKSTYDRYEICLSISPS